VIVAAATLVVLALVKLRLLIIPVIVALFLSTLLYPPVTWLRAKGWPSLLATWVVFVVCIGVITGLVFLLAPQVSSEIDDLGGQLKTASEDILTWLAEGPLDVSRSEVSDYVDQASKTLSESSGTITSGVLSGAIKVAEMIAALLLTLVLLFFFVNGGEKMWQWILERSPKDQREDLEQIGNRAWRAMGAYIRGTALVALVDAILIGAALLILGVPLAVPLILLTFVGGFFPLVGATMAGIVSALVALVGAGVTDALIVAGWVIVVQQVEGDVLQPVVMGRAVRLHPVVILLSLTAGALVGGVAGAFLSVPTVAVATAIGSYYRQKSTRSDVAVAG
jgi:putative heme transporter